MVTTPRGSCAAWLQFIANESAKHSPFSNAMPPVLFHSSCFRLSHIALILGVLCAVPDTVYGATTSQTPGEISFNRHIRPILSENCFSCHGFDPEHRSADLRLDTFEGATGQLDGPQAIEPGDVEASELWIRITSDDPDSVMPPPTSHKPALSAAQRALIKKWIEQGAPYEPHWSFVAPERPQVASRDSDAIDFFVEQSLQQADLSMSPQANAETLLRRVSLDLIGLPPTLEEMQAFEKAYAKDAEGAYKALVDRLLDSPHYGERWARWWLDQARYADSNGYAHDNPRSIWKFRDWVIQSLNSDKPFDQFTIEQLAGDLLPESTTSQKIATGFHRNTSINTEGGIDVEQFRIDSIFDRVATTGTVWLGLTIGCAQCHDHKFDPIEQKEYYQLFAFLNNQDEPTIRIDDQERDLAPVEGELNAVKKNITAHVNARKAELEKWQSERTAEEIEKQDKALKAILAKPADKRSDAERLTWYTTAFGESDEAFKTLRQQQAALESQVAKGVTTMVLSERAKPRKTNVYTKGDFTRPAEEVTPGTPAVLHPYENKSGKNNRLDLAQWIMSDQNPLTARVIANRIWQQYFGRGLVETENDFGSQGSTPSHPELLDWLATELVAREWSLKSFHRLIVMSRTYRQSSLDRPELREKDPNNYLLGRQQRIRLDAEIVRDAALTSSGLLAPVVGGPPVFPPIPSGAMNLGQVAKDWKVSSGPDRYRRGVYTFVYRASPPPSLSVFDAPDGQSTCTRRIRSNTPLQALTLLNDPSFFEFATTLQKIIETEGTAAAFRRCTSREPSVEELAILDKLDPLSAARVLLNLDETVTRD